MDKKNPATHKIILIVLLLVIPFAVMALMGFGNYDADEFRIISTAVLADVVVFIAYKLLLPRFSK